MEECENWEREEAGEEDKENGEARKEDEAEGMMEKWEEMEGDDGGVVIRVYCPFWFYFPYKQSFT